MTTSASRRGFSMIEFVIIAMILAVGITTLYQMFWSTSEEAFKSKWAYLATHAAREELEAIRTMNLFGHRGGNLYTGHDWIPVEGSCLKDIATDELAGVNATSSVEGVYDYPKHYDRIHTRVEIAGNPQDRVLTITLWVRYQQKGTAVYGFQTADGTIKPIGIYQTLVVNKWYR